MYFFVDKLKVYADDDTHIATLKASEDGWKIKTNGILLPEELRRVADMLELLTRKGGDLFEISEKLAK